MIDAKEARRLYDESGKEVANFLCSTVEPAVIQAAELGKRHTIIQYHEREVTPTTKVVEELIKLGYSASVVDYGEPYVPKGLRDDDGNGPLYCNVGIRIVW
jgi:hypothetical protein